MEQRANLNSDPPVSAGTVRESVQIEIEEVSWCERESENE